MLLLVGLGNPGSKYGRNRHNVGFVAADAIHRRHGFSPWRRRFQAQISEGRLGDAKVLLIKPQTFMNKSGQSVGEARRFFKVEPRDVVVIHDEVDLPPGKIRVKDGGGAAGHNGLKSVSAAIGRDYRRIRIGVGHPGRSEAVPHFVLHDFAKADRDWLDPTIDAIAEYAPLLAEHRDSTFANRIHETLADHPSKPKRAVRAGAAAKEGETTEGSAPSALARGLRKLFGG